MKITEKQLRTMIKEEVNQDSTYKSYSLIVQKFDALVDELEKADLLQMSAVQQHDILYYYNVVLKDLMKNIH